MIIAKLIGGLGNTMFQYAIARIIADQKQCNLLVEGIDTLTKFFPNAVNVFWSTLHLTFDARLI